jgi:hypothetical protein
MNDSNGPAKFREYAKRIVKAYRQGVMGRRELGFQLQARFMAYVGKVPRKIAAASKAA